MSLELYDKYRDENGYIDLNKAEKDGLFNRNLLRQEIRGSDRSITFLDNPDDALKGWFDFETSDNSQQNTFLVRTNMHIGEDSNYGDYAELIYEEIAKKLGIDTAHYDLFKYNNAKGVLSQKIISKDESLIALGDNQNIDEYTANMSLDQVEQILKEDLTIQGSSTKQIQTLTEQLKKIVILDAITLNADRHLGNIGLVLNSVSQEMRLVTYDNEYSFLLDYADHDIQTQTDISSYTKCAKNYIYSGKDDSPIGTIKDILSKNPELSEFVKNVSQINMTEIFNIIENRIHAKIPMKAKNIAKISYNIQAKELVGILNNINKQYLLLTKLLSGDIDTPNHNTDNKTSHTSSPKAHYTSPPTSNQSTEDLLKSIFGEKYGSLFKQTNTDRKGKGEDR